jgi:hypothetical protein
MGKVKELWQEERDRQYEAKVHVWMDAGYTETEAHKLATNEMEEEDIANGQFGVGA